MKQLSYIKHRPQVIRVMGRNFLLMFHPQSSLGDQAVGMCNNAEFVIDILGGMHPVEEFDTVLHEIQHAVWFVMSASMGGADEEQIVRRLATGMTGVYMDNPQLLKYFSEIQKVCN